MRIKLSCFATLLTAWAATLTIAAAPMAASLPTCTAIDAPSACHSPGHRGISDFPRSIAMYPGGALPYLAGGH